MELEKRGIPTVTICTDAFVGLAREESKNLGMPDLAIAIVEHPIGGLKPDQVAQRAQAALEPVISALTRELR
ncbi:MAG: hypothetical protein IIA40_13760 [SAR324 cluster bacterium]|nr:hypothetical protein [SAR324 cluster bacterium]